MTEPELLIVFVKAPRAGGVKSRLAASIGVAAAAVAYRELVRRLLDNLAGLRSVELRFTPDDVRGEISAWLRPGWGARPQGEGDLGARLAQAFAEAFARGYRRVATIGSDCPEVTEQDVRTAWAVLSDNDVVLGPALDGGYWLVGLAQPQPALFTGIPWSTAAVLSVTRRRCAELGLRAHLLRELADVDTLEDWQRWVRANPPIQLPAAANHH